MPGKEFMARMAPEFAQHVGSARENASRQAAVERLIAKAEYEYFQVRRDLMTVLGIAEGPAMKQEDAAPAPPEAAEAAEAA
jgi:hypothetical protein